MTPGRLSFLEPVLEDFPVVRLSNPRINFELFVEPESFPVLIVICFASHTKKNSMARCDRTEEPPDSVSIVYTVVFLIKSSKGRELLEWVLAFSSAYPGGFTAFPRTTY